MFVPELVVSPIPNISNVVSSFSLSTGRHAPVLEAGAWSTMQCTMLTNVPATSSTSKALAQCSKMVFAFPFVAILTRSLSCGLQEMQVEA